VTPQLSRVGVLINPNKPNGPSVLKGIQTAARQVHLTVVPLEVANSEQIIQAFTTLAGERVDAFVLVSDAFFNSYLSQIAEFAAKERLPSIYAQREHPEAGGLMSYGDSLKEFM